MYEEQFERVKRWYERFKRINEGISEEKDTEYYHDEVYAFFLNCYHLKDWIRNDTHFPKKGRDTVTQFVRASTSLSACRDICNSLKHLVLDSPPSARFGSRHFKATFCEPTSQSIMAIEYSIITRNGRIDAFDLATKCLTEWEEFIKSNTS